MTDQTNPTLMTSGNKKIFQMRPSDFTSRFLYLSGNKFSFQDYEHMLPIYDIDSKELVLKTSRQIGKCLYPDTLLFLKNGSYTQAKNIVPGNTILSYDVINNVPLPNKVKGVEIMSPMPIYKIVLSSGRKLKVSGNHPILTKNNIWKKAEDLDLTDIVIQTADHSCMLPKKELVVGYEYRTTALSIAKGNIPTPSALMQALMLTEGQVIDFIKIIFNNSFPQSTSPKAIAFFSQDKLSLTVLQELLLRLGVYTYINDYKVEIREVEDLHNFLNIVTKENSQVTRKKKYVEVSIIKIELFPEETTINIEMEDPHKTIVIDSIVTHNSTTLANLLLSRACMIPYYKQLYVSPSVDQTKVFSNDRVGPAIEDSPFIKKYYLHQGLQQNVFTKQLANGSRIYLRYAQSDADRLRGLSLDSIYWDEAQDIDMSVVPIVSQAMSRSMYKKSVFSGTPKRTKGTLASLWYRSTMYEWFTPCEHCNRHNYLDDKNIGLHGAICRYCGKSLNTKRGTWISTGDPQSITKGFRVNMLMFHDAPWVDWYQDVIMYRKNCPSEAIFFNEVLGLEYDDGVSPITEADIRRCCTGGPMQHSLTPITESHPRVMGIDYGPMSSNKSNTVLSVLQKNREGKPQVLFIKKYRAKEADYAFIHEDVPRLYTHWQASVIGADAGLGDGPNAEIRRRIGAANRLIAFRHLSSQKSLAQWNPKSYEYTLNRTKVMTQFFRMIKNQEIVFPRWEDFSEFANDILSVYIDYDDKMGNYKYVNDDPDDSLHSILYAELTLRFMNNQHNIQIF